MQGNQSSPPQALKADEPNLREWERDAYNTAMVLVLGDGRRFEGSTLDVSPGGIFLNIQSSFEDVELGEHAELHISPHSGSPFFSCSVARIKEGGLGLKFSENASFGAFITHDMLLTLIGKLSNAFAQSLDLKATIDTSVHEIKKHLKADASSLFLMSPDGESVICSACAGPVDITGIKISSQEGVVGRSIRERRPKTVQNVEDDPFFSQTVDEQTGFKTLSLLCAPMIIQGEVIGALEVVNKRDTGFFTKSDEVALMALASTTALAIHTSRQATILIEHEAKIRASEMNYQFISSLNHRLHTPLNSVLGFAQMLESDKTVTSSVIGKEAISQIVSGGNSLMNMVDGILTFAEIESGKIKIRISDTVWDDTYQFCLEAAQKKADPQRISFVDQGTTSRSSSMIVVDEIRFKDVMENVFDFAIYSSLENSTIKICKEIEDQKLQFTISFSVKDAQMYYEDSIFAPYASAPNFQSTGMELAIAKNLVKLMKGDIGIVRPDDKHLGIWITFPIAPPT